MKIFFRTSSQRRCLTGFPIQQIDFHIRQSQQIAVLELMGSRQINVDTKTGLVVEMYRAFLRDHVVFIHAAGELQIRRREALHIGGGFFQRDGFRL